MVAGYAKGVLVLHARGDSWPVGRSAAWLAGVVIVAWATFGGLGLYSHVLFSAHMVAHMLLSMVAPILLVLGAPVTLALRTLPSARVPGEYGPRQLLIGVLHSGVVRVLTHPLVAAVLFVGSLYAIYFSGLFTVLMDTHLGHAAMTVHFLAVGSLFFYVLVGVDPGPRKVQPLWRFGLLLIVMPFHAFFSIALMSTNTVLGETYWRALDRPYRTDLLADQTLGGSFSWALGEAPIILVMIAVFVQWARSDARDASRSDRAADRVSAAGRDDEMDEYNAYLASLSATSGAPATHRGAPGEP
jgi:putative copper resistance protein D